MSLPLLVALLSATGTTPAPERVYVGVYLADVSGFDINEGRFKADLMVWCKWLGGPEPPKISFANGEIDSMTEISRESDGDWRGVRWRVQGTFRGTFPLHEFPFDRQQLRITFELPSTRGELVPDLSGSGMASEFSITGWIYEPYFAAKFRQKKFSSDFGSIENEGKPREVSSVSFTVDLHRPFAAYLVKFVLPLLVILFMAVVALWIPPEAIEVRGTIGVTALLSCVALQFTMSDAMPDVSYLVTADKLLMGGYIFSLVTLVASVFGYRWIEKDAALVRKVDRITYVTIPVLSLIGAWALIGDDTEKQREVPVPFGLPAKAESARDELVISVARVKSLNAYGISTLLRRGLFTEVGGKKVPHMVEAVPELTNEYVRFLPDGGMVVTWRLRPGLRWSDGQTITAADVVYSAEIWPNEERRRATAIDDRTAELEYRVRNRRYLESFTIYPKHAIAPLFDEGGLDAVLDKSANDPPPGDGPYVLKELVKGDHITLAPNRYFAGNVPAIGALRFQTAPGTVAEKIMSGKADLAWLVGPQSYRTLEKWGGATVRSDPLGSVYFLQPDLSVAPFDDPKVRKAIMHAIDREAAARVLFGTEARVAHTYAESDARDYAKVNEYAYDPAAAKALLAHRKGPVAFTLMSSKFRDDAPEREVIEKLVSDLNNAGFTVKWEQRKGSSFKRWKTGDHGTLMFFSRRTGSAPRFWNVKYADGAFDTKRVNRLWDAELVSLYEKHRISLFEERRIDISRRMQRKYADVLPTMPLFYGVNRSMHPKTLVGWDPTGGESVFWNVTDWHFEAK